MLPLIVLLLKATSNLLYPKGCSAYPNFSSMKCLLQKLPTYNLVLLWYTPLTLVLYSSSPSSTLHSLIFSFHSFFTRCSAQEGSCNYLLQFHCCIILNFRAPATLITRDALKSSFKNNNLYNALLYFISTFMYSGFPYASLVL
jgi:hypothetical protein